MPTTVTLSAELDRARMRLYRIARAADPKALTRRPANGNWSALENMQHLIFAEQAHLGRFLPQPVAWSPLGVKHHTASKFWPAGTETTSDLEHVLQAWSAIHRPIRKALATADPAEVIERLPRHIKHLESHTHHIERLLRDPAPSTRATSATRTPRRLTILRERWSRDKVAARLTDHGASGTTSYILAGESFPLALPNDIDSDDADRLRDAASASDTGAALFVSATETTLIIPPFPIEATSMHDATATLLDVLARPRAIGVFLLRLGGYSCGFFRGDTLVDSKTGRRFVKNRHRKGGQSQRRFDRIREKQTHEHFGDACETAKRVLTPYDAEIERVFLGGDRHTLQAFRKECEAFDHYGDRLASRLLAVPGDPRRDLLAAIPREVWSSDVFIAAVG